MAYSTFSNPFGFSLTPWVKRLLIINTAAFLALWILPRLLGFPLVGLLAFTPADILRQPWTILTYMFVHADFWHLLINMLGLFFFGPVLEERWGSREFLKFYLLCGIGGALLSLIFPNQAIVGASAAVYGVMVAFAMYWPDNPIYIWGIFPIKAKWLVTFLVGLSLFYAVSGGQSGTAHLAHLGGAFAAFGYLKTPLAPSPYGETYRPRKKRRGRDWRSLFRRHPRVSSTARAAQQVKEARNREAHRALDDVDRILDKISAGGMQSLTPEERRRLEEASRQLNSN
jgi:membrane associated rhomboid family serine protease